MESDRSRRAVLALCAVAVVLLFLLSLSGSLPLVGGEPEPSELSVASFDRLETGCAEDVATYASSSHGSGSYEQVSFVETGNETAELAARTERTSPPGAALETFRVYVESTDRPHSTARSQGNASCRMGVQYRLELNYDRGSSGGFFSGDDGTRVLWLENGEYSGCSASTSGSLDAECHRFTSDSQSNRTWATPSATG